MNLKKGKFLGAIVLSLFLLSSCKSLKNTNTLFQSEYDKFADTATSVYVANENNYLTDNTYRIKPFDLIGLKNLQNPEGLVNSSKIEGVQSAAVFRTDKDGKITLPVIGSVEIINLTPSEAAQKIQKLYGKTLLRDPIIELIVVNYQITILGEVSKPGNFALERENVGLIEVIGKASGLTTFADPRKIKIIRKSPNGHEVIYVNLKNLNSLSSKKLILQNDDIIYIAPRGMQNVSESLKNYLGLVQPILIVLNAILLINTLNN